MAYPRILKALGLKKDRTPTGKNQKNTAKTKTDWKYITLNGIQFRVHYNTDNKDVSDICLNGQSFMMFFEPEKIESIKRLI